MKVDDFRKGRVCQPDEQFVADCGLPPEPDAARIAIAVRRAVASIGLIDPQFIRADDAYPGQLEVLPLWDSIDWLALLVELEWELGTKISDQEGQHTAFGLKFSVKQLVVQIYEMLGRS